METPLMEAGEESALQTDYGSRTDGWTSKSNAVLLFLLDFTICAALFWLIQITPAFIYGIDVDSETPWWPFVCQLADGSGACWSGWFVPPIIGLLAFNIWRAFRYYRTKQIAPVEGLPYSCVPVMIPNGPIVYMVGTMHVSPGSPVDVKAVCSRVSPDAILIELDKERWERLNDEPTDHFDPEEIEAIVKGTPKIVIAIPAEWNACHVGREIHGELAFDNNNPKGATFKSDVLAGKIALVHRGDLPFALKACYAAKAGATALLCIDAIPTHDKIEDSKGFQYPCVWIPLGGVMSQLSLAWKTKSCDLPPIPCFLINHNDGQDLLKAVLDEKVETKFFIRHREDMSAPHSLCRNLCQMCVVIGSGIGVLYGMFRCAGIQVGAEFIAANDEAKRLKKPFVLVDVSMDDLGGRMKRALIPWPRHIFAAIRLWMMLPRWLFRNMLFPAADRMDLWGAMFFAIVRFKLRTWVAFVLAVSAAGFILTSVLMVPGKAISAGMVATGHDEQFANLVEQIFMMILQLYCFPRIFDALVTQRDEAMFQSITSEIRRRVGGHVKGEIPRDSVDTPMSFVVVVGAMHVNGIVNRLHNVFGRTYYR
eukprot:GEMP01021714.1.p1 GENE.GEMP01021714.1~~GEMP01021714.1.p1  ORF type:complete len:593 (+),score=120.65 GEMP01021714.1:262-2040(+)